MTRQEIYCTVSLLRITFHTGNQSQVKRNVFGHLGEEKKINEELVESGRISTVPFPENSNL